MPAAPCHASALIPSGSLEPGVDPAAFGLPPATALRYERPDARLRPLLSSYTVFDSDPDVWRGQVNSKLPGGPQLWIILGQPMSARLRRRRYGPLGRAVLYGATSTAIPLTTSGGVSVAVDVGPAGWARWFKPPAYTLRDQIAPLETLWPADQVAELTAAMAGCGSALEIKARLDAVFLAHVPPPARREADLARVSRLVAEGEEAESSELARRAGLGEQQLRRLALRTFGFGPKMLIRRTRVLRAVSAMLTAETHDFGAVPSGYASVPHFHRDAREFLGTTARRFVGQPQTYLAGTERAFTARPTAYLAAMLRARTAVIGAPVPLLDRADEGGAGELA